MAKKDKKTPVQPIRMYLLKETVGKYKDAIRDKIDFDEFSLKPQLVNAVQKVQRRSVPV